MKKWNQWVEENSPSNSPISLSRDKKIEILKKLNRLFPEKFCCNVWHLCDIEKIEKSLKNKDNERNVYFEFIKELCDIKVISISLNDIEEVLYKYNVQIMEKLEIGDWAEEKIGYSFQPQDGHWIKNETERYNYVERIDYVENYEELYNEDENQQQKLLKKLQEAYYDKVEKLINAINVLKKAKKRTEAKDVYGMEQVILKFGKVKQAAHYVLTSYIDVKVFQAETMLFPTFMYSTFPNLIYPEVGSLYKILLDADKWKKIKRYS